MSRKNNRTNRAHVAKSAAKANPATATAATTVENPAAATATAPTPATVLSALGAAIDAVSELTVRRAAEHLSVSRLRGVARELGELVKVMSAYTA